MEKTLLPETITGQHILLKRHDISRAEMMFKLIDQDRARLRNFFPWVDTLKTIEDEAVSLKSSAEKWEKGELFGYAIFETSTGNYIGNITVTAIDWSNESCQFGYWLLQPYESKGLMSDAVQALEATCFKNGFHRIELRCSSLHERSSALPKRLSYTLEGRLVNNTKEADGRRRDTLVFAKLNKEH